MHRAVILLSVVFWLLAWTPRVDAAVKALGRADAPKGGSFVVGIPNYPKGLLFYLAFEETAAAASAMVLESLVDTDPETNEQIPLIAKEWTISPDKKIFTFKLDPSAKFSDGKPVTTEDVKFTWDTVMNPKNKTAPIQSYFGSFESAKVIDPHTIEFQAKTVHFKNLEKFAGLMILPKHVYSKGDFNKAFNNKLTGSGPYRLEEAKHGERIVFKRNPDYWGKALVQNLGRYNFDKVTFRAVPDNNVAFELFKKGDVDYFYFLSSKMWMTETDAKPFKNNYIVKIKAENKLPYATQGFGWNLRRPLFQDKRVRKALAHLYHYDRINKELLYGNYIPATGPVHTRSEFHPPSVKPVPYDPKKAKALLEEAGWKPGPDGVLVKDGKRFEYEHMTDNPMYVKMLTIYQEELKKMGIVMNIRTTDWATRIKLVDDWQFDSVDTARGRDSDPADFAVSWGSKEADIKGSANFTGYKNPELDALAAKIDQTFDKKERIKLVHKIVEMIAEDQPWLFVYEGTYLRLAHWNKFSYPGKGYFNYSGWKDTFHYWWADTEKEQKLKKAMAAGTPVS